MIHFICNKDVVHNGTSYKQGQAWDGDPPAPQVGTDWTIRQDDEPDDPHRGGVGASSSKGYVQWKPQPGRVQSMPLTQAERAILGKEPYSSLDDEPVQPPPAPVPPPTGKQQQEAPTVSTHLLMTAEEKSDPYGKTVASVEE